MKALTTKSLVRIALLMAITIVLAATPLGYVYIPVIGLSLTIMVLPVALGGALLGIPAGIILGLTFGITSLIKAPTELLGQLLIGYSPFFAAFVCVAPRVIVGIVAGLFGKLIAKKANFINCALCGAAASLTNTILFIGLIYIFCGKLVEGSFGVLVWSTTIVGGLGEAVLAAVLCGFIIAPIKKIVKPRA